MSEESFNFLYLMLYGAQRTVAGLDAAFDTTADYYRDHKDEAKMWMEYYYETVAGAMYTVNLLLDELTRALTDGEIELIRKEAEKHERGEPGGL